MRHFVFFFLLMVGAACSSPRVVERQNLASLYQTASPYALSQDHQVKGDSLIWWLRLPGNLIAKQSLPTLRLTLTLQAGYTNAQVLWQDTVRNLNRSAVVTRKETIIRTSIALSKLPPGKLLTARFSTSASAEEPLLLDLLLSPVALQKTHVLLQASNRQPLFRHFFNPTDTVVLVSALPGDSAVLKRYQADFVPAQPPMALREPVASPTLPLLDTRSVRLTEPFLLTDPGFYTVQVGGTQGGILLVGENKFPDLSTAKELIEPLRFLTTSKEREALYKADDPKQAVDKFWLDAAGNATQARSLIRTYYTRVADANRLFTSHKQGWMSDRGMIFIGLGRPTEVHRTETREVWNYANSDEHPAVVFIFLRQEQPLTLNHFELVRDPVYEPIWYEIAERWRKGFIEP